MRRRTFRSSVPVPKADLLTLPADEVYKNWYKNPLLTTAKLEEVFQKFRYVDNTYYITITPYIKNVYELNQLQREIKEPLDERWFDYMIKLKLDKSLCQLAPREPYELCQRIGEYFYNELSSYKSMALNQVLNCLYMMEYCSYNKFEGAILNVCKNHPQINGWELRSILYKFRDCTDAKTASEETKKILEFYEKNYGQKKRLYIENILTN